MLLSQDHNASLYTITQIKPGAIYVNDDKYEDNIIVMPRNIIYPWKVNSFEQLSITDFSALFSNNSCTVLLGVGDSGKRCPFALYHDLLNKNIAIECMSIAAACRTYAILSAEGRNVALALLLSASNVNE